MGGERGLCPSDREIRKRREKEEERKEKREEREEWVLCAIWMLLHFFD